MCPRIICSLHQINSSSPQTTIATMGSCFSKQDTEKVTPPKQNLRNTTRPASNNGHVLGGGNGLNPEATKAAAGRAAEERFNAQQEKSKNSQQKLKAMEKMSRKDKGLE